LRGIESRFVIAFATTKKTAASTGAAVHGL
jgi:hypothetical protein